MATRRELLERFVESDPKDAFSRYALALELEKEGLNAEAIAQMREVIAGDPAYVAAYYHLGRLLSGAGDTGGARIILERGLQAARGAGDKRTENEIQDAIDALA